MPLSVEAQKAVEWIESHYEDWQYRRVVDDWDISVTGPNGEWVYRDVPGLKLHSIPGICHAIDGVAYSYGVRRDIFEVLLDTYCTSDGYCNCWVSNLQTVSVDWTEDDERRYLDSGYILPAHV